jgi:acyl carrier protein
MTTAAVPSSPQEAADLVLAFMRAALDNPAFGAEDDFFTHGGDSILAVQVVTDLERATGRMLPIAYVYTSPTAAELGAIFAEFFAADDRATA